MRRVVLLLLLAVGLVAAPSAGSRARIDCSAAQKASAQRALAVYERAMPKQRAAYYGTHRKAAQRRTFVKAQQAKLRGLRAAAACNVVVPSPPRPPCLLLQPTPRRRSRRAHWSRAQR